MTTLRPRFQRADSDVYLDARRALDFRLHTPATVRLQVHDGIALLSGRVCWRADRAEAEAAVGQIPGTRQVVNHIAFIPVAPEPASAGRDVW